MLFERQRLLLTLLDAVGEPVGDMDFQGLLFLYTQECEATPSFEFVPLKLGAFSFTACADKRKLIEGGLLAEDDQNWKLTKAGRAEARRQAVEPLRVAEFCWRHSRRRGNALIVEQRRRHCFHWSLSSGLVWRYGSSSFPREAARRSTEPRRGSSNHEIHQTHEK
jgi:hypothetical protein